MHLRIYPLRITLQAREPIRFPANKATNTLRGTLGLALRDLDPTLYTQIFDPQPISTPSGIARPPRPFVLRASHLDGRRVGTGEHFHFDFHLFEMRIPVIDRLTHIFANLKGDLVSISGSEAPLILPLDPSPDPVSHITVQFLTPTELKSSGGVVEQPDFATLACRIRDRISSLKSLYDDGPLPIDFLAFGERASRIRTTRCELRTINVTRRSTRTGLTHFIGGFIGEADYEGDLTEFLPYLSAAQWTGVGRQTAWGKGTLSLR